MCDEDGGSQKCERAAEERGMLLLYLLLMGGKCLEDTTSIGGMYVAASHGFCIGVERMHARMHGPNNKGGLTTI